ncbi:MAG: hypothetical protein LBO09_01660 [Candidatus Peribacteria bacterium]|jgi:hypothetical protein|nr:hypothetical protein [Candidatus Peribacteria bacterium]
MYLTTKSFYQTYLSSLPATQLFPIIKILDQLLQLYGPYQLQTPAFQKCIHKISPITSTLLSLLIQHKKLTKKSVKSLLNLVASYAEVVQSHFTISSPNEKVNLSLEKELKKQFKQADFSVSVDDEIGLKVK